MIKTTEAQLNSSQSLSLIQLSPNLFLSYFETWQLISQQPLVSYQGGQYKSLAELDNIGKDLVIDKLFLVFNTQQ